MFKVYIPKSHSVGRQRKPAIRVETQENGRARFHFYSAVRDWLEPSLFDNKRIMKVVLHVDWEGGQYVIQRVSDDADHEGVIDVRGLGSWYSVGAGYITLPGFTLDYPTFPGLYEVELDYFEDSKAVYMNLDR